MLQPNTHYPLIELTWRIAFPLLLTILATWAVRTGGWRRLWAVMGALAVVGAVIALQTKSVVLYYTGPLSAAWVATWVLPVGALATAIMTHILGDPDVPASYRGVVVFIISLFATIAGVWTA